MLDLPTGTWVTLREQSAEFKRGDGGLSVMVYEQALGQELPDFQEWKVSVTQELGAPTSEQEFDNGGFRLNATFDSDGVPSISYLGGFQWDS